MRFSVFYSGCSVEILFLRGFKIVEVIRLSSFFITLKSYSDRFLIVNLSSVIVSVLSFDCIENTKVLLKRSIKGVITSV